MTNRATGPISVNGVYIPEVGCRHPSAERIITKEWCATGKKVHNDFCYDLYSKTTQNLRKKGRVLYIAP